MDAYLRQVVSCCVYTTIIRQRKKDFREIEKYCQKDVYFRIAYNSFCVCMCLYRLYLRIVACVHDDTYAGWQI